MRGRRSGAIAYLLGDKAWYTYGASSNEHRNVMPNYLMQWEMIRWAKESGCSLYDFRGVSQSNDQAASDHLAGLNRFMAGFNAAFIEYIGEFDRPSPPRATGCGVWQARAQAAMRGFAGRFAAWQALNGRKRSPPARSPHPASHPIL